MRKETATYVEMPLDELERKYDPQWLQEKVVSCPTLNPFKMLQDVFIMSISKPRPKAKRAKITPRPAMSS